ncbi:MAG: hypothetical protein ACFHXK_20295 [bacterium]
MSERFVMPDEKSLAACLTMIYGEEPELHVIKPEILQPDYIANYIDAADKRVAQCISDMSATVSLACALSLIPIPTAQEMIQTKTLTPIAEENFHEVMNIFSSLFMNDKTDHLTLHQIHRDKEGAKGQLAGNQSIGYEIAGVKYPQGRLLFTSL